MSLADRIREVWKPAHLRGEEVERLIERTELALETVSPEAVEAFCRGVGLATAEKRRAAEVLAMARHIMDMARANLPLLF